jgi:response regulator RpfG family c-di-GMP phosphodiesterase
MNDDLVKYARILIVDDQQPNIAVLVRLLKREGFQNIESTTDSQQALALFTAFDPDIVLLDLLMPHLDGYMVMEQIRTAMPPDSYLPILVLTADISHEARQRALAGGARDFLTKPIDVAEVVLRIRNLLETRWLHRRLQQQNRVLEKAIQERTAELVASNQELQREIAARQRDAEQLRLIARRMTSFDEISRAVSGTMLDLQAIMDIVVRQAADLIGDLSVLSLQSSDDNLFEPQAFFHSDPEIYEYILQLLAHQSHSGGLSPVTRQVIASGKPLLIANATEEQFRQLLHPDDARFLDRYQLYSLLQVPLRARAQVIGTLSVVRLSPERPYTLDDQQLIQDLADRAALAITNARLFEDAKRRLEYMQALRGIDIAITSSMDISLSLAVVLEHVTKQLRVDAAAVLLMNPHMQALELAARRGFTSDSGRNLRVRLGEGYAGRAALERRTMHFSTESGEDAHVLQTRPLADERFCDYYGVPLIARGQVRGVLEVFHRSIMRPDQEWLDFLEALASQTAIAIENMQLLDRLHRANDNLMIAYDATIEGWSRALDLRDKETEGHSQRVTEMTLRLAEAIGVSSDELIHARRGALLHDVGKLGIPDAILLKPGKLTEEEWQVMRMHPTYAYEMLSPIGYLRPALDIPYCHHEKWDGTGYPRGLKGEQIPLPARIFAVVDVWDALRSDRPYRLGWPAAQVYEHIRQQSGTHFDARVVDAFLALMGESSDHATL